MEHFIEGYKLIEKSKINDENPTSILVILDLLSYIYELQSLDIYKEAKIIFNKILKSAKKV